MEFEWDAAKSQACFDERGFDFSYAAQAFSDPARTIEVDGRRDYGEDRYRLTGVVQRRLYVVVYTQRPGAVRIISAHKANQRETRRYEDSAYED